MKKQCSKKKQMWSRYLSTGRCINYIDYKKQNNKTVATIRDAKAGYEKKLIVNYKKRPKPFFKYMRSNQKTKTMVQKSTAYTWLDRCCSTQHKLYSPLLPPQWGPVSTIFLGD